MKYTEILPFVMVALQVGAGLVYWHAHDARHTVYWFAGAVITASVTW